MPTDACQVFYDCMGCGAKLRPKAGDCCVFCSYGDVPCPPIQATRERGNLAYSRFADSEFVCHMRLERAMGVVCE
ncbi:hypothetical protein K9B32_22870 [Rhizobium sp. 3T7]|nr:hypothetical protein [Rhizobium sp. 3T7]